MGSIVPAGRPTVEIAVARVVEPIIMPAPQPREY